MKYFNTLLRALTLTLGLAGFNTLKSAPAGTLDTTFNSTGKQVTNINDDNNSFATSVAALSNSNVAVAGVSQLGGFNDFVLALYNSTGAEVGQALTDFGTTALPRNDYAYKVAVQPADQNIVVAGSTTSTSTTVDTKMAIARYKYSGGVLAPDDSFNNTGTQEISFPDSAYSVAYSAAVQPDNYLVLAGAAGEDSDTTSIALTRLAPNGQVDARFGIEGYTVTRIQGSGSAAFGVALQKNGKIVIVGGAIGTAPGSSENLIVARYTTEGNLDFSFGNEGTVTIDPTVAFPFISNTGNLGGNITVIPVSVGLQSDDKIVISVTLNGPALGLIRLTADGALDNTTFGSNNNGTTSLALPNGIVASASQVSIQENDDIVVTGTTSATPTTNGEFIVVRYNADGKAFDNTFGPANNGYKTISFMEGVVGDPDYGLASAIDPETGNIIVAGANLPSAGVSQFAVGRLIGNADILAAPIILTPANNSSVNCLFTIDGTATPGALVDLSIQKADGDVIRLATVPADASTGIFAYPLNADQAAELESVGSVHTILAVQRVGDATSPAARAIVTISECNAVPSAPTIEEPALNSAVNCIFRITGSADPEATVNLSITNSSLNVVIFTGSAIADANNGEFEYLLTALQGNLLPLNTPLVLTATQTVEGVTSLATTRPFTVNTCGPRVVNPPVISNPGINQAVNCKFTVVGQAESLASVVLSIDGRIIANLDEVSLSGEFTYELTTAEATALLPSNSAHTLTATQTVDGITSAPVNVAFTISTCDTAINAPVISSPFEGQTFDTATPLIEGTGTPGSVVNVFIDGNLIASRVLVDGNGIFTAPVTIALDNGVHTVVAVDPTTDLSSNAVSFVVQANSVPGVCPTLDALSQAIRNKYALVSRNQMVAVRYKAAK